MEICIYGKEIRKNQKPTLSFVDKWLYIVWQGMYFKHKEKKKKILRKEPVTEYYFSTHGVLLIFHKL